MRRSIIVSIIGHTIILGSFVATATLSKTPTIELRAYTVGSVDASSIKELLDKATPREEPPTPRAPQVQQQVPDKPVQRPPRPQQPVKPTPAPQQPTTISKGEGKQEETSEIQGIRLDTEFDFPEYLLYLRDTIQENWNPPKLNNPSMTRVYFRIGRDGTITFIRVDIRTGNTNFDRSAWDAVNRSNPLEPLPELYTGSELGVHFDFIYEN